MSLVKNDVMSDRQAHILLVEDDSDDVKFVRRAFSDVWPNCEIHSVGDGEEALSFLRRTPGYEDAPSPDLILLDLNMPRKGGHEVLLEIKQDDALKHIPVVVMTTTDDKDTVLTSYKLHANSFITKPVGTDELNRIVQTVVDYWFSAVGLPTPR